MERIAVSIDNSSLSQIVRTDESVEEFFKILESRNIALNVPSDCLMELANGDWIHNSAKHLGVSYRLERFVNLATKFYNEGKILLNELPQKIIGNEVENSDVKRVSVSSVKGANIALFAKERHKQIHTNVQEANGYRKKAKSAAEANDEQVKASKAISSIDAEKYLKSLVATQSNPQWREFLHSQFTMWIFGEKVSLEAFNKIMDGQNCRVVIAFVNLLLIHHLAVFLDVNSCSREHRELIEIDKNSLPDILIASMAAYSDYFICDDFHLRARCNFLENRGLVKFKTIPLGDLLLCKRHRHS